MIYEKCNYLDAKNERKTENAEEIYRTKTFLHVYFNYSFAIFLGCS